MHIRDKIFPPRPECVDVLPFFLSFFFFFVNYSSSKLAKRNSTIIGHMLGSKCNLKMHVETLEYTLPLKSWA